MEKLDDSDFDYFKVAMEKVREAKANLTFVQSILVQKYGLVEGDEIAPDGTIIRKGESHVS